MTSSFGPPTRSPVTRMGHDGRDRARMKRTMPGKRLNKCVTDRHDTRPGGRVQRKPRRRPLATALAAVLAVARFGSRPYEIPHRLRDSPAALTPAEAVARSEEG